MLVYEDALEVLLFSDDLYTNYKKQMTDLVRDETALSLTVDDILYIGFYKGFTQFYISIKTPNSVVGCQITLEAFDGQEWKEITMFDETNGFIRSGFIQWSLPQTWAPCAINSIEKYWVRLKTSKSFGNTTSIFGIGPLFCDDNALQSEVPLISHSTMTSGSRVPGDTSYIRLLCASRDEIIQRLRNANYKKTNNKRLSAWDLLDLHEVKQAALNLTISKIYQNLSDEPNDNWQAKANIYRDRYEMSMQLASLTLDKNDNGVIDASERAAISHARRITR